MKISSAQLARGTLIACEIFILSVLIVATRCSNYQDVFLGNGVYFTDADCYARMTRVRMCADRPGLILRQHDFENYPIGTVPHTTAPLDYMILALSVVIRPLTNQPLDLAGALISPLVALLNGWFLWWWLRQMRFRYRWTGMILYVVSPILAHGAELGRPDHQSLLMLLVSLAVCAEWRWQSEPSRAWSLISGIAWSLAVWISAYEPLLLLLLWFLGKSAEHLVAVRAASRVGPAAPLSFWKRHRPGGIAFIIITILAVIVERRVPALPIFVPGSFAGNWSRTIGELKPVSLLNPLWLQWAGFLMAAAPFLIWLAIRKGASAKPSVTGTANEPGAETASAQPPVFILLLFVATFALTTWQARWGYFFILIFSLTLPALLQRINRSGLVWAAFAISILPILRAWDDKVWPNEPELARRIEWRQESMQLRDLSISLRSSEVHAFLAPWWLSPSIAYWSEQPGVAGSSHESLPGIVDSARFFLAVDQEKAGDLVENRDVSWIAAYDADRVARLSAIILGTAVPEHALCYSLDRAPAQAPRFLVLAAQNPTAKLFRVAPIENNR